MAEAIVSKVAKLLDDFPEVGKLWGGGGEFDHLKESVSLLQNYLHFAENRGRRFSVSDEWLRDVKDAFYDAEDLIEEWKLEDLRRKSLSKHGKLKQQVISSFPPLNLLASRPKTSDRARVIRGRIEKIAERGRCDFQFQEYAKDAEVERGARNRERSDSFVYDEAIMGRDEDKTAIKKFLLDSDTDEQISVLLIVGISGIGKTALARSLYEDDMVKEHFELRKWVCAGNDFHNLKRKLRIIRGRETTEGADDMLKLKKYLLVIDDLWFDEPDPWGSLKSLLIGGAQGSKILITTLSPIIADVTSPASYHLLKALSTELSFDLLMRIARQEEEKDTKNSIKRHIGWRIAERCAGSPLAIRIMGSLFFFEKTEEEWSLLDRETYGIRGNDLRTITEFGYIQLPCHLKWCFAFCSLFPRDSVIDKVMLTSLWMAEGFIQPVDNVDQDMEDIAHDYFMDLLRRNFFQDCTKDELGNVTSCKMHEFLNDIACKVSKDDYSQGIHPSSSSFGERTRHLSWDSTLDLSPGLPPTLLRGKRLRTFIKMDQTKSGRCGTQMGEEILCEFLFTFKFLRVLDWHDSGIESLPSSIGELKHLAFLDLSENEGIVSLLNSMTRLQTLQVLKLNMCYKLIELPRDIRKLVNLRQLEISNCNALSYMPEGMGRLTLLRTLSDFILPGDDSCPKNYSGLG